MGSFIVSTNQHYQKIKQDLFNNLINPPVFISSFDEPNEEEKVNPMEKKYGVIPLTVSNCPLKYKTFEEAEKVAKQGTQTNSCEYAIIQAVAQTMTPVPAIEVVKL